MAFVSLTDVPRGAAEQFARTFSVPWPCGYAATPEAVARWGAYSPSHEVSPTLYLIGPDGCVLWSDGRARMRHGLNPELREADLEEAIERALEGLPDGHHAAARPTEVAWSQTAGLPRSASSMAGCSGPLLARPSGV